jgi:co-chaperonin GroES (HSP10)
MYDVAKAEQAASAAQLPEPVGHHLLISLPEVKEKTEGGIYVPDETRSREETASVVGFVIELGPDCYSEQKIFPNGPWCKKGDWVLFRPYAGTRVVVHGMEFRLLKDNEISAVVRNPAGIIRSHRT